MEEIIKFKNKYSDELGLFRLKLEKLAAGITNEGSLQSIQQHINDIHSNEFVPAYNNFKKALTSFRLNWINKNIMQIAFYKGGTGALLPYFLGASLPIALLVGGGISLATSLISYNEDRKNLLRENPYSYLVSIEKKLGS